MNKAFDFVQQRTKRKRLKRLPPVALTDLKPHHQKKGHRGNAYRNTRSGFRKDIGHVCRSSWESNVCRVLFVHGINYQFEPVKFEYPIKRGNKSYVPDILLTDSNEWIEVKGYLGNDSKIKLKRFKRYYPEEFNKLIVITSNNKDSLEFFQAIGVPTVLLYKDFKDYFKSKISNWEGE